MIYEFSDIHSDIREAVDVCVIGTGAGGAVAAAGLAEKGLSVVVLEEGGRFSARDYTQDPGDMIPRMWRDSGMTAALGLPPISIPLGRCIGGTTAINSATCFRPPEAVIAKWAAENDCAGLSYEMILPYVEKVEKRICVTELPEDVLGNAYQIVKRGAAELGLTARPLRHNVKECQGVGVCQFGCPTGAKQSTDVSYIPAADAAGAKIYANCRADRLSVESGRVRAVSGKIVDPATGKAHFNVEVRARVVCLAMGAMITPAFLLKQRLANISGQVGRNLTIHPCGSVAAEMDEIVDGHHGVSQGGYIGAFAGEGIMLEGIFTPPGVTAISLPGAGEAHKYLAAHYRNLAAFGVMVSDTGRGRIFKPMIPGIPFAAWYMMNRTDTEKLRKGIGIVADIFLAAGARRVFTGYAKMPVLNSRTDLERFKRLEIRARHFKIAAFHPLGTCRMGNDPRTSVLNTRLECHDIKGLFIPDGSPFPTSLGVNPQITIMAFAARCADHISDNIHRY